MAASPLLKRPVCVKRRRPLQPSQSLAPTITLFMLAAALPGTASAGTASFKNLELFQRVGQLEANLKMLQTKIRSFEDDACNRSMAVAQRSNCPSNVWHDAISNQLAHANMTYVNVGANKGFNINDFLYRYQVNWSTTPAEWFEEVIRAAEESGFHVADILLCGACGACTAQPPPRVRWSSARQIQVVAVELVTENVRLLQSLFTKLKVPGMIVHAAASNVEGSTFEPTEVRPGIEHRGMHSALSTTARVDITTVDRLAATHAIGIIDVLSIDTEGSDAYVLAGASQLLKAKRVRLVEFEYHSMGGWQRPGRLHDVVKRLASFGYTCFWQGNSGRLAPLLPWCNGFDFRKWSNIVCTCQAGLADTLRSLAV